MADEAGALTKTGAFHVALAECDIPGKALLVRVHISSEVIDDPRRVECEMPPVRCGLEKHPLYPYLWAFVNIYPLFPTKPL